MIMLSIGITIVAMCCFGCLVFYLIHSCDKKRKSKRRSIFQNKVDNLEEVVNKELELLPEIEDIRTS